MSTETMGPKHRQCDNDDCERIHDFCPLCEEKITSYTHFETDSVVTEAIPDDGAENICIEWGEENLWLYWH